MIDILKRTVDSISFSLNTLTELRITLEKCNIQMTKDIMVMPDVFYQLVLGVTSSASYQGYINQSKETASPWLGFYTEFK